MDIQKMVAKMTLEEKAGLCSGADFWHTKAIERLDIPAVMLSDGPSGLRKQAGDGDNLGLGDSIKAVCFPSGSTVACSFDRDLIREMGESLGQVCQHEDIAVLLGPAVNIKRSPLCGRNFEYLSEDPYVASEMAASEIIGVQSKQVGTSIKHFLANNQENRRMTSSSEVDERTLREIYLAAFEGAVTKAKPWTVMCSYNLINGIYASENEIYLKNILRDEWGFDGFVVSDWGAVNDRVAGIKAGLDLEMPSSHGVNDARIVDAVRCGDLNEADLDRAVSNILKIVSRFSENRKNKEPFDIDAQDRLARKIAGESMVLLKNEGILPLPKDMPVAFIGQFASTPRYQGGGSSHVNAYKITSAMDAAAGNPNIVYAPGWNISGDVMDENCLAEATDLAKASNAAVIFAGLPESYESEGFDRTHMAIPAAQTRLIEEVSAVQPNTIVVLHNGSPIEMPWIDRVKGVLEVYLGGQGVGRAAFDSLFGDINPSGRLAETFPVKLEDNPSYLFFTGEKDVVEYREGIFVGYRYYDKKKMDVLFPFGHGLSYTTFAYSDARLDRTKMTDQEILTVEVDVTNTGTRYGKEVVQLYVADQESTVIRPVKELKGFEKIDLEPGETKTVTFKLSKRAFAYYNNSIHDWHVETGAFDILIGHSSRVILDKKTVWVEATRAIPVTYTLNSTFGDIMVNPQAASKFNGIINSFGIILGSMSDAPETPSNSEAFTTEMIAAAIKDMPLRAFISMGMGKMSFEDFQKILDQVNE